MHLLPTIFYGTLSIALLVIFIVSVRRRLTKKKLSKTKLAVCIFLFCISLLLLYLPLYIFISWAFAQKISRLTVKDITPTTSMHEFVEVGYSSKGELFGIFWNPQQNLFFAQEISDNQKNILPPKDYSKVFFSDSSSLLQLSLQNMQGKVGKDEKEGKKEKGQKKTPNNHFSAIPIFEEKKATGSIPAYGAALTKKTETVDDTREIIFSPPFSLEESAYLNTQLFSYTMVSSHKNIDTPEGIFFSGTRNGVFFDIFYAPHSGKLTTITAAKKNKTQNYAPYYWNAASMLTFIAVHLEKPSRNNFSNGNDADNAIPNNAGSEFFVTKIIVVKNPLLKNESTILEIPIATSANFLAEYVKIQGDPTGRYLLSSDLNEQHFIIVNEFIPKENKLPNSAETTKTAQENNNIPPEVQSYTLTFPSLTSINSFAFSPNEENVLAVLGKSNSDPIPRVYLANLAKKKLTTISYPMNDWIFASILFGLFITNYLLGLSLETSNKKKLLQKIAR